MEQKKLWMRLLLIGVNIIIIITIITSCKVDDKYLSPTKIKVSYINKTDSDISYFQYANGQQVFIFEIEPMSSYVMQDETEYLTNQDYPFACCHGYFEGFQGLGDILVAFDNNQCLIYENGTGTTTENLEDYDYQVNDEGVNEFTYTFTDNDLAMADDCD